MEITVGDLRRYLEENAIPDHFRVGVMVPGTDDIATSIHHWTFPSGGYLEVVSHDD